MTNVYLSDIKKYENKIQKTFTVEWFGINATFIVNEYKDDVEIDSISVIHGDIDHINEIIDHHLKYNYEFECDTTRKLA